jgi:hypothetical protein
VEVAFSAGLASSNFPESRVAPDTDLGPDNLKEIVGYFKRFLSDHPEYKLGSLMNSPVRESELQDVYKKLMHGAGTCSDGQHFTLRDQAYLQDLTNLANSNLSRDQMQRLVADFSEPRNYVNGYYAGPFSGYQPGDHWGMKRYERTGSGGIYCEYGWMGSNEKTVLSSPPAPVPLRQK